MMVEWLALFIIISIILFILSLYAMEENPMLAIPMIMVNMIFTVIIAYGFWNVEWFYISYDGTPMIHSTYDYGNPYSYIFLVFFFIQCLLFVKTGWNLTKEALKTKGEMNYRRLRFRSR